MKSSELLHKEAYVNNLPGPILTELSLSHLLSPVHGLPSTNFSGNCLHGCHSETK